MKNEVKIFVYGSCHSLDQNGTGDAIGNGGYGVVINLNGKRIDKVSGGFSGTTNARMDIIGITEGLKRIIEPSNIVFYLTNQYVIDTLTKGWLERWKKEGFKKKKHVDLWIELDKILKFNSHTIVFEHSKDVKFSPDFKLAEQLGKEMSSKQNHIAEKPQNNIHAALFADLEEDTDKVEHWEKTEQGPILDSVSVDASTIQNPGPTEYRGVDTKTKAVIFQMKYEEATNNIGEFLAIVHALALYKKEGKELKIIYSDSLNAISWVRQKKCKTKFVKSESNAKVFEHIQRAITWLQNNQFDTKILKWNTEAWGEIPADYGRK